MRKFASAALLTTVLLSGCQNPVETPTIQPGITTTPVPTQLSTAIPTVIDTPVPLESSPQPTAIDTPVPLESSPQPTTEPPREPLPASGRLVPFEEFLFPDDEPVFVFLGSFEEYGTRSLFLITQDASQVVQLIDEQVLTFSVQPTGTLERGVKIAYVTRTSYETEDVTLKMLTLPQGTTETITELGTSLKGRDDFLYSYVDDAITDGGMAWSPDGLTLAFVAALHGPSVDLYTYALIGKTITRLSDGPQHAFRVWWSPDGQYIVHGSFEFVGMGGPTEDALWAAPADPGVSISLLDGVDSYIEEQGHTGYIWYFGWRSSSELLFSVRYFGEISPIVAVDVATGDTELISETLYNDMSYVSHLDLWAFWAGAGSPPEPPVLIQSDGTSIELPDHDYRNLQWIPSQNVFLGFSQDGGIYSISPSGEVTSLPIEIPSYMFSYTGYIYPSPDETVWAWHSYQFYDDSSTVGVGDPMMQPKIIIEEGDFNEDKPIARDITWSPGSQRLIILGARGGFWQAERPDFVLQPILDEFYGSPWYAWEGQWIP